MNRTLQKLFPTGTKEERQTFHPYVLQEIVIFPSKRYYCCTSTYKNSLKSLKTAIMFTLKLRRRKETGKICCDSFIYNLILYTINKVYIANILFPDNQEKIHAI